MKDSEKIILLGKLNGYDWNMGTLFGECREILLKIYPEWNLNENSPFDSEFMPLVNKELIANGIGINIFFISKDQENNIIQLVEDIKKKYK